VTFSNIDFREGVCLREDGDSPISLEVEGHSMAGKKGEDIICSAVSALSQTAVKGLAKLAEIDQELVIRDGYLRSEFQTDSLNEKNRDRVKVILDILCIGILEIIKSYPGTVEIDFK
jgi:uncharacterized protein YsxB (DUF464 family)